MIRCPYKKEFNPFKEMKGGEEFEEVCTASCEGRSLGNGCRELKTCNAYQAKKIEEQNG